MITTQATSASNSMKAMMFLQLIIQLFLRGSLDELWNMFFALQVMCYFQIYDVPIPSNTEIYIEQFTKLIEFDILNPEGII